MPKRKTKSVHVPYRKTVYIAGYPVTAMKPRRGGGVDLLIPEGCPLAGEITEVVDLREPEPCGKDGCGEHAVAWGFKGSLRVNVCQIHAAELD